MISVTEWHWFGLAIILGILDVTIGANFFLLWLALAASTVGAILMFVPKLVLEYQLLIFALESFICIVFWYAHLKRSAGKLSNSSLNRRSEQYIGRAFVLHEAIVNGRGRIKVGDSYWIVQGPDAPAGTQVTVTGTNGVILEVTKRL